jgi:hypothetical protein
MKVRVWNDKKEQVWDSDKLDEKYQKILLDMIFDLERLDRLDKLHDKK